MSCCGFAGKFQIETCGLEDTKITSIQHLITACSCEAIMSFYFIKSMKQMLKLHFLFSVCLNMSQCMWVVPVKHGFSTLSFKSWSILAVLRQNISITRNNTWIENIFLRCQKKYRAGY